MDANVLLYAINSSAPLHRQAKRWLEDSLSGSEPVGLAWMVLLAVIRLATNPAAFSRPLDTASALGVVEALLSAPAAVVVAPTARHASILAALLLESGSGGNLVADAHLAALAVEHQATVASYDRDFGRFRGVRVTRPE